MAKWKGSKVKTLKGELRYLFIDGEGRNQARQGEEPKFQYVGSMVVPENGPVHKDMLRQIDAEWEAYKKEFGVKGRPKSNGIKPEMVPNPDGTIDPETEEVERIPTGNVVITFKTYTTWPDGNKKEIKVFDHKGTDITKAVQAASWSIGNGTTGVLHGIAQGNNVGGDHKVTLYLEAVQIAKLVKYEGSTVEAEEIEGEDIDLDGGIPAIGSDDERPEL